MVKCNKCGLEKLESEFNFNKSKNRLEYHCKKCHSEYLKSHYQRNKEYYKNKAKKRTEEIRKWFVEYKSSLQCAKCGEDHPACLDFHHIRDKELNVSEIYRYGTKKRILLEIDKCIVLCSNCHRKLHYNER